MPTQAVKIASAASADVASAFVFKSIEVETKFPFANSISEFSRSQDPYRKWTVGAFVTQ
jgi:hypothetical protein